ncbi:MAG: hypothetical protein JSW15_07460 [Deltaproteobacteria bacterium]|nr:MAG: hypothetical protein JSW15_07460 [Deltaproteobacteria bacterium]
MQVYHILEDTNKELVKTLKKSVELLTQVKPSVPDPQGWRKMLDVFKETIKVGERVVR